MVAVVLNEAVNCLLCTELLYTLDLRQVRCDRGEAGDSRRHVVFIFVILRSCDLTAACALTVLSRAAIALSTKQERASATQVCDFFLECLHESIIR